jgi:tetratricopeptide (TPR) repeat protein
MTLEDKADLHMAISLSEEFLNSTYEGLHMPSHLCNAGYYYTIRSELRNDAGDLDVAEEYLQRALSLLVEGVPLYSMTLKNMASSHAARFRHSGRVEDISQAISRLRQALTYTVHGHPDLSIRYNIAGIFLRIRPHHRPQLQDLDGAISYQTR